jgi:hypothetical protein
MTALDTAGPPTEILSAKPRRGNANSHAFRLRQQVNQYKKIQFQPVDNF